MKVSKYIKLDRDVLLEYIYDDGNLIGEPYKSIINIQDNSRSFISGNLSGTNNTQKNQLFQLDKITNKYGLIDTNQYNFLQIIDQSGGLPIRHDRLRFHFPVNYTFGTTFGFMMKLYTFDFDNVDTFDLSNFFFDVTDMSTLNILNFTSPPFVFQETLWGKYIEVGVPSIYALALQRDNNAPEPNSMNYNITDGKGVSMTAPILIDFHFLTNKDNINNIETYNVSAPKTVSIPQVPEYENLGCVIKESDIGDFFEIFGTFNGSIGGFGDFVDKSFTLGKRYYVEYSITLYEENIKGKTLVFSVTDNFNEEIEYRPIVKFSTTTAVIDVEMRMIDVVDESTIIRRASYGMLQDQIGKYSINMSKININNASKPKVYNLKNGLNPNGVSNALSQFSNNNVQVEQIKVPFPVFQDRTFVVAKSDSVKIQSDTFYGMGKLQITIYPFDNIITMIMAEQANEDEIEYMDLNNGSNLRMVFKNDKIVQEGRLYKESERLDLENGILVFRIDKSQISDIRKIFNSGINPFYITSTPISNQVTTIIYSGTFTMYDSVDNLASLNDSVTERENDRLGNIPTIIEDEDLNNDEYAIITKKESDANVADRKRFDSVAIKSKNLGDLFQ